jgi:pimeloyl-ACP methyl ester carboxylesterase
MNFINAGKENSCNIDIYYEDYGSGKPVVLIHGWPLSSSSWEKQIPSLIEAGYRVIAYDRRGFGHSSKPASGYNYDTEDLNKIMTKLNLRDATLVGFSMGGGEVARYLSKYGSERVNKAVFMSAIPPFLLKTSDNPEGVDGSIFDGMKKAIKADRPAFLSEFFANFYNVDNLIGTKISDEVVRLSWNIGAGASPKGTLDCVSAWLVDFREELKRINIPVLIMHGNADRILPLAATGKRTPEFVKGSRLVIIEGAPHGMNWTHSEEINRELLAFLNEKSSRL